MPNSLSLILSSLGFLLLALPERLEVCVVDSDDLESDTRYGTHLPSLGASEACDGYLVIGALWGDVAPWWMRSESDKVFTYSDSFNNLRMEFVTDNTGKAIKMIHNLKFMKTPLENVGPLPDKLKPCIERPKR